MKENKLNHQIKNIFATLFIATFITMLGLGFISPLMPIFARNLGANGLWLGVIFAGFPLARAVFMPLVGKFSDKKGRKIFIATGLFLYTIISFSYLLASNVLYLIIVRFFHGIASAMVIPITMAYIGEIAQKGKEGKTMGMFNLAFFLGMASGPFLGGLLKDCCGFNAAFIAMGTLTFISFIIISLFLPNINMHLILKKKHHPFRMILKNNLVKAMLVFRFITAIGRGGIMSFLPIYASRIHLTPSKIGFLVSLNIIITAIFQGFFGKMADRQSKIKLIYIGTFLGALSLFLIPFTNSFSELILVSTIMGFSGAISMPAASAIIVNLGRDFGMGSLTGLFNTAMSIGMIISPLLAGVIFDLWGIKFVFIISSLIILFSIFILEILIKKSGLKYS